MHCAVYFRPLSCVYESADSDLSVIEKYNMHSPIRLILMKFFLSL